VDYKDKYLVHYGAADNYIALAYIEKEEVMKWVRD